VRRPLNRILPLVAVVAVTLAGALAPGGAAVSGTATSATTRAAADGAPAIAPDVRFPAGGPSVAAAWDVAARHWGSLPCGGEVEFAWTRLDAGTNATASWYNPTDAWNNAAENFDCRVDFNVEMDFDWEKFCTVLAHEAGHLLGRRHVAGDLLMDPTYSRPLPACQQSADPAAPAPVAAPAPEADETVVVASAVRRPRGVTARWAVPGVHSTKAPGASAAAPRCLARSRRAGSRRVRRFACVRGNDLARPATARRGWQTR
jgi:hypothetical protein